MIGKVPKEAFSILTWFDDVGAEADAELTAACYQLLLERQAFNDVLLDEFERRAEDNPGGFHWPFAHPAPRGMQEAGIARFSNLLHLAASFPASTASACIRLIHQAPLMLHIRNRDGHLPYDIAKMHNHYQVTTVT